MNKNYYLVLIGLVLIGLDRLTKIYFIDKIFWFFNYSKNYGFIFGVLQNSFIYMMLTIFLISTLIFLYTKNKKFRIKLALALIISGLISNLIDRIFLGYVIDIINLRFLPVFNLADLYSMVGIIMLLIFYKKWQL